MKTKRREIEGLSLSFLDVISCGFGALILLLVLTKVFDPSDIKVSIGNLEDYLISLQEDILAKRNDNRDLRTEIGSLGRPRAWPIKMTPAREPKQGIF